MKKRIKGTCICSTKRENKVYTRTIITGEFKKWCNNTIEEKVTIVKVYKHYI